MSDMFPQYQELRQLVELSGLNIDISYAHGVIAGFICSWQQTHGKSWLEVIIGVQANNVKYTKIKESMLILYTETQRCFMQAEFDFQLLLPDESCSLQYRAEALSEWCQGFLIGLAMTGLKLESDDFSEDMKEILFHFSEFSKLDYGNISVSDSDELAFTEVYEYVRNAVMMFFIEREKNTSFLDYPYKNDDIIH